MIVPMKKLTILCVASAKDETLGALRELGVLHLSAITPPSGKDLDAARTHFERVKRALEVLPPKTQAGPSGRSAEEVVEDIWRLIHKKDEELTRRDELKHEIQRIEPLGDFDPASVEELARQGVTLKLYHVSRGDEVEIPPDAVRLVLSEDKNGVYFAVARKSDLDLAASEIRLPVKPLRILRESLTQVEKSLAEIEDGLASHAGDYSVVAKTVRDAEDQVEYVEALRGMGDAKEVAYLRGFCPEDSVEGVRQYGAKHGWGLVVEEPSEEDKVPTLIRLSRWVKPIKAVFDMIGIVPGYREIDISPVFLIFLSIFFAMLVGDAGYGLIFIALTWAASRFAKQAPRHVFSFLYIMSVSTVIWGVLTGNYFGYFSPSNPLPAALQNLTVPWLVDQNYSDKHIMMLCFLLGAIQLTVAHLWNAIRFAPSLQSLAQIGWVMSTWTMYFAARFMVLGDAFPPIMLWVLGAGILLIVLFMTPPKKFKEEWFNHAILPLNIISNFTDVVSYVRLFAVGTASFAVANAFNVMLLDGGWGGFFSGLVKAMFLFAGHTLNIALCGLGILVHGVRLNTLEFSSHVGMQWSGFHYRPFARGEQGGEPTAVSK